jgi:hypothetical protein
MDNDTAPCVMLLMRANPLRGQVGGGWALEIETFFGPMKWHRAIRRVPFREFKKVEISVVVKFIKKLKILGRAPFSQ